MRTAVRTCVYRGPDCGPEIATYLVQGPYSSHQVDLCGRHAAGLMEFAYMGMVVGTPRGQSEASLMDGLWEDEA